MSKALHIADELLALHGPTEIDERAAAELRRLHAENEALKTVMVAAAEEISEHWDAHCDDEGYGPANLMRRLEQGIPSQYGYTAGGFERLRALNAELVEALRSMLYDDDQDEATNKARAALAKARESK